MKIVKKLKPGQLCTIHKRVYRCTKAVEETVPDYLQPSYACRACEKTNGYRTNGYRICETGIFVGFACAERFGYNCYPKKLINQ